MKNSVQSYVSSLNRRNFTNNTQRVLYTLLQAAVKGDGWVSLKGFRVSSAGSRIRDLRQESNGGFNVTCSSAAQLGKAGNQRTFYYRIGQRNLTVTQLRNVFGQ